MSQCLSPVRQVWNCAALHCRCPELNASCKARLIHELMAVEEPARDENIRSTAGTVDITSRLVQVGRSCKLSDDRAYRRAGQVAVEQRKVSVLCRQLAKCRPVSGKWVVLAVAQWRIFLLAWPLNIRFCYLIFICLDVSLRQVMMLELAEDHRVWRHAFLLPCRTADQLNNGLSP
jgi:hypothetical protein